MLTPTASIVIPTYNRRRRLARVLAALEDQSAPRSSYEVLVVDDGSTDGTAEWVAEQEYGYALRLLCRQNGGPASARNAGVEAARGRIVIFVDDDLVPGPHLVREHIKSHAEDPRLVVLGPLASLPHYRQPWVSWEQAKIEEQYRAMSRGDWEPTYRQFWSGNASVAREHLLAAGGFDKAFKRAEDVELGYRLMRRGLGFRFNPRAAGLHHAERGFGAWCGIMHAYGHRDVEIWRRFGETDLSQELAKHWRIRNPLTRLLVRWTVGRPARRALAHALLVALMAPAFAFPDTRYAVLVCAAMANIHYWQGVSEAVGADLFRGSVAVEAPSALAAQ